MILRNSAEPGQKNQLEKMHDELGRRLESTHLKPKLLKTLEPRAKTLTRKNPRTLNSQTLSPKPTKNPKLKPRNHQASSQANPYNPRLYTPTVKLEAFL